jgi:hypothetical protein
MFVSKVQKLGLTQSGAEMAVLYNISQPTASSRKEQDAMSPLLRLILGNFRDEAVGWLMLYSTAISAPDCVRSSQCKIASVQRRRIDPRQQ